MCDIEYDIEYDIVHDTLYDVVYDIVYDIVQILIQSSDTTSNLFQDGGGDNHLNVFQPRVGPIYSLLSIACLKPWTGERFWFK